MPNFNRTRQHLAPLVKVPAGLLLDLDNLGC
jgi:hypothetical protein